MDEIIRRKLIKCIGGSAFAGTAFSGVASASESDNFDDRLGLKRTKQDASIRDQQIGKVWSAEPVKEMRSFLKKEYNITVTPSDLDAYIIESSEGNASFRLFRTPFEEEKDIKADVVIRDLEDGTHVSATIGTNVYKSSPSITNNGDNQSRSSELEEYGIITGQEWSDNLDINSDSNSITTQNNCDFTWDYPLGLDDTPPNWVCEAVFYLGGLALAVYPEPTTSGLGIAIITITAGSGGCSVAYTIEDETEVNLGATIIVCLETSCEVDGFGVNCDFDFQAYLEP